MSTILTQLWMADFPCWNALNSLEYGFFSEHLQDFNLKYGIVEFKFKFYLKTFHSRYKKSKRTLNIITEMFESVKYIVYGFELIQHIVKCQVLNSCWYVKIKVSVTKPLEDVLHVWNLRWMRCVCVCAFEIIFFLCLPHHTTSSSTTTTNTFTTP